MFNHETVVVTGAAGGLGRAVTHYFLRGGAKVVAIDYSETLLEEAFPEADSRCQPIACDLTDRSDCLSLTSRLLDNDGQVSVLCNIAGGFQMGEAVYDIQDAAWDFLFNLNTKSVIYMTQKLVPAMVARGRGKVINVGAAAAIQGQAYMGAYLASKSATIRLTESLSEEVKASGVNVNCVMPGVIDTPRNRSDMPDADFLTWVPPEKLAEVIGFLASDAASAIHGASVPVRGLS